MNASDHAEGSDAAGALAAEIQNLAKTMKTLRPHLPSLVAGVEQAAVPLLAVLETGPRRVSELADACHLDQSTSSRQAATLARRGLVEKSPDPTDRRAQVLALTDAGRETLAAVRTQRAAFLREALADWDDADVVALTHHLRRLGAAIEARLRPGTAHDRKED